MPRTRPRTLARRLSWLFSLALLAGLGACSADESDAPRVASVTPTSPDTAGATSQRTVLEQWVADQTTLVKCYRENGAPDYPDVDQWGQPQVVEGVVAIPEAKMRQVLESCEKFVTTMPPEVAALMDAQSGPSEAQRAAVKEYAECMQGNGAPQFPDPGPDGWAGDFEDPNAPGAVEAAETCAHIFEGLDAADDRG